MGNVIVKPTLAVELAKIKAIVRHITKHEADRQQAALFKAESRIKLRRFPGLGILAHQLAIAAYCKVTDHERDDITESLLQQTVGSNPKQINLYKEMRKTNEERQSNIMF